MLAATRRLLPTPFLALPAFLRELADAYGPIATFATPWRRFVLVNEPALVKDVLVTQQSAFSKSQGAHALRLLLGEGLLTSEEPYHRRMRRIVQPAFHRERIAGYARTMQAIVDDFVARMEPGVTFDLHAAMVELTLRIATTTLFGIDASGASARVGGAVEQLMQEFPYFVGPFGGLRNALPTPARTRFRRARRTLDAIVYDIIAQRRRDPGDRGDALSMLLEASDPETGYRLSDEQVRDEAMTLFLAGHETTANALTWTLYLIAQDRAAEDILGVAAQKSDRAAVERVLREGMRLYPPAWILGREAQRNLRLVDGSAIARRTTIFVSPYILHRMAALYPQPERFDPDRWIDGEGAPFAYVPFGGGARRCIGEEFAWSEGIVALRALSATYRFVLEPGTSVEPLAQVTLRPSGPIPVRAIPR